LLADERRRKREALLAATENALEKILKQVQRRTKTPLSAAEIGKKLGQVLNHFKVGKHFEVTIADGQLSYARRTQAIEREAELDGLYVIRTSEAAQDLSAEDTMRGYKNLAQGERAFRTLKGMDLQIRPIYHRSEERVRAHIFLCLLAYYVEWHMRQALAPLLFDDETLEFERKHRDPVAPAKPSPLAKRKKAERITEDGLPIHSFATLVAELAMRCRNRCQLKADPQSHVIYQDAEPTPLQTRVLELIRLFLVQGI
jgi:hypothetical protein